MPINYDQAMSAEFPEGKASYEVDDVILYHLGVGAGNPPTAPGELQYTYEKGLKTLPSFAVVAPTGTSAGKVFKTPGLQINPAMILHGEQDIEIHQPLPAKANYKTSMRIADIYDAGKAAILILEINFLDDDNTPLFTTRMSAFLRGEGGFGGSAPPKAEISTPTRDADGEFEVSTLPQQALLYRLNGDKNPLHADPKFAKMAGFGRPILHGLCSYGIACKGIVDHVLDGDVDQIARYQARFSGVAFPGETFLISYWREDKTIYLEATSKERKEKIISHAAIALR